ITDLAEIAERFPGRIRVTMTPSQESKAEVLSQLIGYPQCGFGEGLGEYRLQRDLHRIVWAGTSASDSRRVMERPPEAGKIVSGHRGSARRSTGRLIHRCDSRFVWPAIATWVPGCQT